MTDEELAKVKKQLDDNGIKVNSFGSPIGKYPIEDDFESYIPTVKRAFEIAKILGTRLIRMFSFFVKQEELDTWEGEVLRRLGIMAELAAENGIILCHENESRIFGQQPREVAKILTAIPTICGIFDPANYRMNGADVTEGIKATLINFKYMHIKDAIYDSQTIVRAGRGEGKIAQIIDIVNEHTENTVYLTLEPHLHVFDAYKSIDEHELKGEVVYKNSREAFDAAVTALKELLINQGYREDGNGIWTK